jgi:hypothetical protein
MDGIMKNIVFIITLLISGVLPAQVSINGGGSMLVGFGNPQPFGGFHIGVEVPRDDAVSIFGRYTHHFKQRSDLPVFGFLLPKEFTSSGVGIFAPGDLYTPTVDAYPTMNYNIIEGGTRYYLGNGFDYGFAAYGGTSIMLIFNRVKAEYAPFNEEYYEIDTFNRPDGSIFSIGFGLGGGLKYSFTRIGTLYFDTNISYMIFAQGSHPNVSGDQHSSLIFNFNLGFRKDILW